MTEDQWPHELGKTVSSNERGETEIEAGKIEKKKKKTLIVAPMVHQLPR